MVSMRKINSPTKRTGIAGFISCIGLDYMVESRGGSLLDSTLAPFLVTSTFSYILTPYLPLK